MRFVIITAILGLLAQPVSAQKVYYCETTAFVQISEEDKVANIRSYLFKMAVLENTVKISGADFYDFNFDTVKFSTTPDSFLAVDYMHDFPWTIANFTPPRLEVMDMHDTLSSFTAHCEDF